MPFLLDDIISVAVLKIFFNPRWGWRHTKDVTGDGGKVRESVLVVLPEFAWTVCEVKVAIDSIFDIRFFHVNIKFFHYYGHVCWRWLCFQYRRQKFTTRFNTVWRWGKNVSKKRARRAHRFENLQTTQNIKTVQRWMTCIFDQNIQIDLNLIWILIQNRLKSEIKSFYII